MLINVNINLFDGDIWTMTATEAADAVLKALGGDEAKDRCIVLATLNAGGEAGAPPPTAPAGVSVTGELSDTFPNVTP